MDWLWSVWSRNKKCGLGFIEENIYKLQVLRTLNCRVSVRFDCFWFHEYCRVKVEKLFGWCRQYQGKYSLVVCAVQGRVTWDMRVLVRIHWLWWHVVTRLSTIRTITNRLDNTFVIFMYYFKHHCWTMMMMCTDCMNQIKFLSCSLS